jgi:hypothetical protein
VPRWKRRVQNRSKSGKASLLIPSQARNSGKV